MNVDELGNRIRARRAELAITQETLAEIADVSVHTISDIEGGIGNPTLAVVARVLSPLGLELRVEVRGVSR